MKTICGIDEGQKGLNLHSILTGSFGSGVSPGRKHQGHPRTRHVATTPPLLFFCPRRGVKQRQSMTESNPSGGFSKAYHYYFLVSPPALLPAQGPSLFFSVP